MYSVVLMAALTSGSSAPDCHWRCGCYGGGYGYGCYGYGCYGGWGGGYGGWCSGGGYGCYGGWGYGCYGGCYGGYGWSSSAPITAPAYGQAKSRDYATATQAQLTVELPADAKLFFDDQPMKTMASKRSFRTPPLEQGQQYYYILRAEVVRDGQTRTETQRVLVRAGQEVRVAFPDLGVEAVTASR
jgi:uncharacterized protein (TIGR03000 family)